MLLPVFGTAPTRKEAPRKHQETRQRTRQTPDPPGPDDPRHRQEDKQTHTGTRASTPGRSPASFYQKTCPWSVLGSGPSFFSLSKCDWRCETATARLRRRQPPVSETPDQLPATWRRRLPPDSEDSNHPSPRYLSNTQPLGRDGNHPSPKMATTRLRDTCPTQPLGRDGNHPSPKTATTRLRDQIHQERVQLRQRRQAQMTPVGFHNGSSCGVLHTQLRTCHGLDSATSSKSWTCGIKTETRSTGPREWPQRRREPTECPRGR